MSDFITSSLKHVELISQNHDASGFFFMLLKMQSEKFLHFKSIWANSQELEMAAVDRLNYASYI